MSALTDTFTAIANKIRAKLDVQTTYTPAEMPTGIEAVYAKGVLDTKVGTASAGDVLSGKTFTNASSVGANGSMTNKGSTGFTITDTSAITIPEGYYNGNGKIQTSGMMVIPSAAINITSNGSHNITNYAMANVNIGGSASLYKTVDIDSKQKNYIPIDNGKYIIICIQACAREGEMLVSPFMKYPIGSTDMSYLNQDVLSLKSVIDTTTGCIYKCSTAYCNFNLAPTYGLAINDQYNDYSTVANTSGQVILIKINP